MTKTQQDFSSLSGSGSPYSEEISNLVNHPALVVGSLRSASPTSSEKVGLGCTIMMESPKAHQDQQTNGENARESAARREEVLAFLAAWEESEAQRRAASGSAGAVSAMDIDYEPAMTVPTNSRPPKLFYRTFWRSITRRLMLKVAISPKLP
jgi:hypothetical protein